MSAPTPPHDPGLYDLFVSYSTKDNVPPPGETIGWVYAFIQRLRDLAMPFTSENITTTGDADLFPDWDTFYAPDEIQAGQLWEPRLRSAVAQSRVLLACLSPNYWASKWCRIEWEIYLENESARGLANVVGGITPIYFVSAPGISAREIVAEAPPWAADLLSARQVRLLDFSAHGPDVVQRLVALRQNTEVGERVKVIASRVAQQISQARRAERAQTGNIALGTETFVGREAELARLENQLFGAGALGVITALRGIGGQGKTALALRYGQNLRSRYSGGCWQLGAAGARDLVPLLASLRESLGLPAIAADDEAATARRVLAALHRLANDPAFTREPGHPAAALLLLDNVDHPELLDRPGREALHLAMRQATREGNSGWLHLLATTRLEAHNLASLSPDQIVPVDSLSAEKALELWRRISGPISDEEAEAAREIITLVERHTLAVEIAARHIRRTPGEKAVTYLARLRHALSAGPTRLARLLSGQEASQGGDLPEYAHPLAATLGFTFDHLAEEDPSAAAVLHYAPHFPAEAVPLPWLRDLAGTHYPELLDEPEAPGLPSAWDRVVLRLCESLGLLNSSDAAQPEIVRLHRLAGSYLRASAEEGGEDAERIAEVAALIEKRCTRAEHDPGGGLLPWERTVLLADLPARMDRPGCSAEMAQNGLVLGRILSDYADLNTARSLIRRANTVFNLLAEGDPENDALQRDLSMSLCILGEVALAQGNLTYALQLMTESNTIVERLATKDPTNADWQHGLSVSLDRLGKLAVAQGDLPVALRRFTKSHSIVERLTSSDPSNAKRLRDLSLLLNRLGDITSAQGDLPGARGHYMKHHAIVEGLAARDPTNVELQRDLSAAHSKLGNIAFSHGDLPDALQRFTLSHAIMERLATKDPANAELQSSLSKSLEELGNLAVAQGDLPGALRRFSAGLSIRERLAASDPTNVEWQRNRSVSLFKLGNLAVTHGDLTVASRRFTESHTITECFAMSEPSNAEWQRDLYVSLKKLGDLALAKGDRTNALRLFTESNTIRERLAASDPTNVEWQRGLSMSLEDLGDFSLGQGDLHGALRRFTDSHVIAERLSASDPTNVEWQRDLSISLIKLGDLAVAQGDLPSALQRFTDCHSIRQRLAASDPTNVEWQRDLSVSLIRLGDLAVSRGVLSEALPHFTNCHAILERLAASESTNARWQRDLSVSFNRLGDLAVALNDLPAARGYFTEDLAIAERLAASDPANAGWQRDLAISHIRLFQFAQKSGDEVKAKAAVNGLFAVLDGMKRRGLHLDPQIAQLHDQLALLFGGGGSR